MRIAPFASSTLPHIPPTVLGRADLPAGNGWKATRKEGSFKYKQRLSPLDGSPGGTIKARTGRKIARFKLRGDAVSIPAPVAADHYFDNLVVGMGSRFWGLCAFADLIADDASVNTFTRIRVKVPYRPTN